MKLIRKIGGLSLCFLAAVILTGCGVSASDKDAEQSPGADASGNAVSGADYSVSGQAAAEQGVSNSAVTGTVDLTPYVTLGKYKGIAVNAVQPQKVKNARIRQEMEQRMATEAGEKKALNDVVKKGDFVRVAFQGYLDDAIVEKARVDTMTLKVGQYTLLKDLEDGLVGTRKGEILTISVRIPDDYPEEYAGERMEYDVKILDAWQMEVPALTDANVRKYLSEKSVKVLKKKIRKELEAQYKEEAEERTGQAIMDRVIQNAKIREYPETYLKEFAAEIREGYEADAAARKLDLAQYISQMGLSQEEYEQQIHKIAQADLASEMVYQAVIQKEGLTLTEEEFRKGVKAYVDGSTYKTVEEVIGKTDHNRLEQRILYRKAYDLVVRSAVINKDK